MLRYQRLFVICLYVERTQGAGNPTPYCRVLRRDGWVPLLRVLCALRALPLTKRAVGGRVPTVRYDGEEVRRLKLVEIRPAELVFDPVEVPAQRVEVGS